MPHRIALSFDTDLRTLRVVRRFVHDLVLTQGGSEEEASALELATGEVLINAYEHAYSGQAGPIEINLLYDEAKVELVVQNHGRAITDAPAIPRTPPSGRRGRGLYLVGQLTDESEVIPSWKDRGGVGVRLTKFLRRSSSPE